MIVDRPFVDADELARGTGWLVKPEGACKGPVCVPLPAGTSGDSGVDLAVLADRLGMALVRDGSVWALGPESSISGRALSTAAAPELELPDLDGHPMRLSDLRGRKVVLAAWASWCGCREDLRLWQALHEELHADGLTVVTVALDTGGAAAARPWIEKAASTHPALIDTSHVLGARFGVVNVPNGVWIDETGQIVRPAEPAWLEDPHASSETAAQSLDDLPADHRAVREQISRMTIDTAVYPRMLRDWARRGEASRYVLPEHEVVARSVPRSRDQSLASAHFELGGYRLRTGDYDAAVDHWRAAHRLQPDNWTYKRQAWNLDEPESVQTIGRYGTGWLDDVRALGAENYYPEVLA